MTTTMLVWICLAFGMAFSIRRARRSATKLRLLLTGPSGSGKTWGALVLAKGLGGRTVVIDTEEGSSDLYDHLHEFEVIDLGKPFTPERYIEAMRTAEENGADIIVIDSITHEWSGEGGCLQLVDELAKAKYRGNTWSAYSEVTPRHRAFLDAMLRSRCHVIATVRSKTETAQVDDGGKKRVVKLGMAAEQRQGAEFEFTIVLDLVHDGHAATTSKDRTNLFSGDPKPLTEESGRRIAEWLAGAEERPQATIAAPAGGPGWLDRVRNAATLDALESVLEEAAGANLTAKQLERLNRVAAARRAILESEVLG